jgi:hypothetical protein
VDTLLDRPRIWAGATSPRDHKRPIPWRTAAGKPTPLIDVRSWRLRLFGSGLHGSPTLDRAVAFSYEDLLGLPSREINAFIECTGNGRVSTPLSRTSRSVAPRGNSAPSASHAGAAFRCRSCSNAPA